MNGFDPACEYLLAMPFLNLFEAADASELGDPLTFRCKGCRELVPRVDRQRHFNQHRGVQRRQETARLARIERERIARLQKANRARAGGSGV